MIPGAWVGVVLVFAAYRLARFVGWDDWPPIARLRARVIGEHWVNEPSPLFYDREAADRLDYDRGHHYLGGAEVELPGKTPTSEVSDVRPAYSRPLLAHLVHCPFCQGFWVSCAVYVFWLLAPTAALYALAPWALSGAVGIIAKNLDA